MPTEDEMAEEMERCGLSLRGSQGSRLVSVLRSILRIQQDPPIALEFGRIYEQVMKDDPTSGLTKAWVHRVLKRLVGMQLVRLENPDSRRKRYIADVNTMMAGLEGIKSNKMERIEKDLAALRGEAEAVSRVDCGDLARHFVEGVMGREQRISSRVVRGKEELHRVVRYNMLDVAKEGDIIRATVLWLGPFMDAEVRDRTARFVNAARRGAQVRYLVTKSIFNMEQALDAKLNMDAIAQFTGQIQELRKHGVRFDVRVFAGEKTYNQIAFNNDNLVLIIAENPVTATWITRDFNPDLIDNAVSAFDKSWDSAVSFLDMTLNDLKSFGVAPGGPISRIVGQTKEED
jgi:hypothetical protein